MLRIRPPSRKWAQRIHVIQYTLASLISMMACHGSQSFVPDSWRAFCIKFLGCQRLAAYLLCEVTFSDFSGLKCDIRDPIISMVTANVGVPQGCTVVALIVRVRPPVFDSSRRLSHRRRYGLATTGSLSSESFAGIMLNCNRDCIGRT
jgi:hypothetical protein